MRGEESSFESTPRFVKLTIYFTATFLSIRLRMHFIGITRSIISKLLTKLYL